ncbi:hypothetical protein HN747_04335 [archaeon]|jgi:hypothetical protein|nr:hypothetical protein [archaeon]
MKRDFARARDYLENNISGFPVRKCQTTARFLNLTFGLEEIAGYYTDPITSQRSPHTWNISKDGTYYTDLSLDQFNDTDTKHAKISYPPINTPLLTAVDYMTEKQSGILTPQLHPDLRHFVEEFIEQQESQEATMAWGLQDA